MGFSVLSLFAFAKNFQFRLKVSIFLKLFDSSLRFEAFSLSLFLLPNRVTFQLKSTSLDYFEGVLEDYFGVLVNLLSLMILNYVRFFMFLNGWEVGFRST